MDSSRRGATLGRVPTRPEVKRAGKKMERVFRFAATSFAMAAAIAAAVGSE